MTYSIRSRALSIKLYSNLLRGQAQTLYRLTTGCAVHSWVHYTSMRTRTRLL